MIVAADIGGTNCRLGLFDHSQGKLALLEEIWIATGSVSHTQALLEAFERELGISPQKADAVVVAIAGPVRNHETASLTNACLELDFTPHKRQGLRFFLINDFIAQAYAILSPIPVLHIAGPKTQPQAATRAVIGAGTGLGQAMLVATPRWLAIPSENGHTPFPFLNQAENAFHDFLRKELQIPYATGDDAITGRGLVCLHHFLTGKKLTAAEIGMCALQSETETLAWYSTFYGRACRNWILTTLCHGGLWIAGGIAAQNPLCVTSSSFRKELVSHPHWRSFLHSVPVSLMRDTGSGLWGAAAFAAESLQAAQSA